MILYECSDGVSSGMIPLTKVSSKDNFNYLSAVYIGPQTLVYFESLLQKPFPDKKIENLQGRSVIF